MILLLDVGNTRVKWAWLEYLEVGPTGAAGHDATHRSWQAEIESDGHRPTRIVVASVAGSAFAAAVTLWARDHYRIEPEFVVAAERFGGIRNGYRRPAALGVDRWLAMIAAWHAAPAATLVVSAGTALTLDAIDGGGTHRGGLIVPGLQMMRETRGRYAVDGAYRPEALLPAAAIGELTEDWTLRLLAALADRSLEEAARVVGSTPRLVLTGGDAAVLAPHLRSAVEMVPDLVLAGLARIATRDAHAG